MVNRCGSVSVEPANGSSERDRRNKRVREMCEVNRIEKNVFFNHHGCNR